MAQIHWGVLVCKTSTKLTMPENNVKIVVWRDKIQKALTHSGSQVAFMRSRKPTIETSGQVLTKMFTFYGKPLGS
jgi:hypothetical protein